MELSSSLGRIVEMQIAEIRNEIEVIERRLAELGDDEEDRVEAILLGTIKKYLIDDLKKLLAYSETGLPTATTTPRTVVEA